MKRFLLAILFLITLCVQASGKPSDIFSFPELDSGPMNSDLLQALRAALGDTDAQVLFDAQDADGGNEKIAPPNSVKTRFAHTNFYQEYLSKYYPKALVITNHFFAAMTPEAVESALKDIVILLADRPFFYFMDDQKKFKITAYWECIADQLSLINEFLCIAYINKDRSLSFVDDAESVGLNTYQPVKRDWLFDWLAVPGKKVLFDFYALCFDYTIKLFNEGILLPDFVQATRYLGELEWLAEKLRGSIYEADYAKSVETAKELYDLLKQRLDFAEDQFKGNYDWV